MSRVDAAGERRSDGWRWRRGCVDLHMLHEGNNSADLRPEGVLFIQKHFTFVTPMNTNEFFEGESMQQEEL